MDPNTNLREQEHLLTSLGPAVSWGRSQEDDIPRLWELRLALQGWLTAGGFEPDWTLAPLARLFYGK